MPTECHERQWHKNGSLVGVVGMAGMVGVRRGGHGDASASAPARMRSGLRARALACGLSLACGLAPGSASADAHACAGRSSPRWISRTTLGVSLVPFGAEIQARAALCVPLRPWDGDWLELAAFEVGALTYVSPVYAYGGGYVQLTPVNLLTFRIEAAGIGYWTLPLEGAGYYALPEANAERNPETTLAVGRGRSEAGWMIRGLAVVQAHVPLGPVSLLVWDTVLGERVAIGAGPYFVNLQSDHTQEASDLVIGNDAALVLEAPVAGGPSLRFGGYDSLRTALGTGSFGHQAGAIFVAGWSRPMPEIWWMEIGLRGGGYTNHPVRTGDFTLAAWVSVEWDLGGV